MWKLALRNVLRQKARTGMTFLAIITGIIGLILSGGFVHDIYIQLGELLIHSQSGHIQLSKEGYFKSGARKPEQYLISDPEALKKSVTTIAGVEDVMGRLYFSGLLNNGRADLPIIGEGVEPAHEAKLGSSVLITAGRQIKEKELNAMMLGSGLAQALRLNAGDHATLVTNTADGALNSLDFEIVGIFQTFSKDYDARAVRLPLAAAQDLLSTPGINSLVISLKRTEDTNSIAKELSQKFSGHGLEVVTWVELNDFYAKTVEMYDAQFGVLRFIILLMVLLSVANSVNMSVFERVGEFGTMMALGNRSHRVFTLIVVENTIIAVAASTIGIVLGVILAMVISAIGIPMPPPPNSDMGYTAHIHIVSSVIVSAFAVGLLATIGASLFPAIRVKRIPVVEALRQNV